MTSDELEFDDASAISPAALARLRRVAASGKVGEEAGKEARREAAWRLGRQYYSARPDGTFLPTITT
jgi:chromosome condensin MukBEF MukE localization factor